jgi:hypothetical protein
MKRSGSGRVARKVGAYDDSAESAESSPNEAQTPTGQHSSCRSSLAFNSDLARLSVLTCSIVVKRPTFGKAKKRSSLRISFGPGSSEGNDGDDSSDAAPLATPKKSNLSRIALEKSAQLRARSPLVPEVSRPTDEERPSYSKDYIAELRNSTPTTPRDVQLSADEEGEPQALDIASKFGHLVPVSTEPSSAIPTQAEIVEKKARRRRLAQQENAYDDEEDRPWASDDDGEDEFRQRRNEISLRPKTKYPETRLMHDDEDVAEGFDDFVEDGRISLGRRSEREAQRKRRAEMAELINDAEGSDDDGSADSDEERNAAFAAAQARAGRYGQKAEDEDNGSKTPPRIAPLPQLDDILQKLSIDVQIKRQRKELILQKIQEFKDDKVRIEERKKYLQEQLQKTGDEYEKLRKESGLPALPSSDMNGSRLITERGLDSLGTTPRAGRSGADSDNE